MNFSPSTWKNNGCYSAVKFHALAVFKWHSDRLRRFSCTAITTRPWNRILRTSYERYYFKVNLKFFSILLTFKRPKCLQNIIFSHFEVDTLRTECEKIMFNTRAKNDSLTSVIFTLASLGRQTNTCGTIIFIALVLKITILTLRAQSSSSHTL